METARKSLKIQRRLELIIWPIFLAVLLVSTKINLDLNSNTTLAFSGLTLTAGFFFYYITYALRPVIKSRIFKNITDSVFLAILIFITYQTKSYASLILIIPLAGSLLIREQINSLIITFISILLIASEIFIGNLNQNYTLFVNPASIFIIIAAILTLYLRIISQKSRFEKAMKEEEQVKLAETNKQLLLIEHQGKEFTTLAAQQIFTPLATIQSFVQTIQSEKDGKLSSRQKEFISETSKYIEKMHKMLKELLFISKIEFSGLTFQAKPVDLLDVIKASIIKYEPDMEQKNIKIKLGYPEELPSLKTDEDNLKEIFDRLIDNAIRYSPPQTEITITLQVLHKDDGPHLWVEIIDHGYGIPIEEQKYLFRKFFRGTNILPFDSYGSGLSLFIIKLIIDKQKAAIHYKSAINQGTSFQIDFSLPTPQTIKELKPRKKIAKK